MACFWFRAVTVLSALNCALVRDSMNKFFFLRKGRVLILEGIEKAENNVLPILNNLLENRCVAAVKATNRKHVCFGSQ
jgi:hypothetical protein